MFKASCCYDSASVCVHIDVHRNCILSEKLLFPEVSFRWNILDAHKLKILISSAVLWEITMHGFRGWLLK